MINAVIGIAKAVKQKRRQEQPRSHEQKGVDIRKDDPAIFVCHVRLVFPYEFFDIIPQLDI